MATNHPLRRTSPHFVFEDGRITQNSGKRTMAALNKIPVTILTGFLGSGKTTFLNYLMKEHHGLRLAIIENEFGEVGIDDGLVLQTKDEVIEMMNGCICCTVREDLIEALMNLYNNRRDQFDAVVIETTGLADPAPVAQSFFVDENIKQHFHLDAIITFVDAKHAVSHLDEEKPDGVENEAVEQVAFADVLVINKIDLVTTTEVENLKSRLRGINATARIIESTQSRLDISKVIGINAFNLEKTLEMDDGFLDTESEHKHDKSVSSVGFVVEGEFIIEKTMEWLSTLLQTKGADIFRSKGIFATVDCDEKFVFQGVHMLLDFGSSSDLGFKLPPWSPGEKRINKFCFIGKNLNKEELSKSLMDCMFNGVYPEPGPKPTLKLRFPVGARVLVNVGDWVPGTVIMHWYRERLWDSARYAPYQVQLDDEDRLVYAPRDTNVFIRKA
jgi:G3E family GTPase